jgi:hypothetical protein
MTDLELLFLVFGFIYCWECVWWARRGTVGFRTWLGRRWRITTPLTWLGNQTGGVIFGHPVPPLGTLLGGHPWPLSVSPESVLAHVPPSIDPARRGSQTGAYFVFDQVREVVARGKRVLVDRQVLLNAGSPGFAAHVADFLNKLRKLDARQRSATIERFIGAAYDVKAVEERYAEFGRLVNALRFSANLLFYYCFLIIPVIVWRFGLAFTWPWLLVGLVSGTLATAVFFHRAHKRLYPALEDERFTHFLIVLLSPASAIRALDLLSRPLLEPFHPLAVAKVFCPPETWRPLAREYLRELRFPARPLCPRGEAAAQAAESYARGLAVGALETFLRQNRVKPDELLQPPQRSDSSCLSFCPRCSAQFTSKSGTCRDCGGLELIAFGRNDGASAPPMPR